MAGDAGEALHVEHLLHGDAAAAVAQNVVPAAGAAAWGEPTGCTGEHLEPNRRTTYGTAGGAVNSRVPTRTFSFFYSFYFFGATSTH